MIRELLAKNLRAYREASGLSAVEVSKMTGKSPKTIFAWEQGRGQPDADMLIKLCDIYQIGSVALLLGEPPSDRLSRVESDLLSAFRALNDDGKRLVIELTDSLAKSGKYISLDPDRKRA